MVYYKAFRRALKLFILKELLHLHKAKFQLLFFPLGHNYNIKFLTLFLGIPELYPYDSGLKTNSWPGLGIYGFIIYYVSFSLWFDLWYSTSSVGPR